ncbi:hypothetical protein PDESU_03979 [Pontiella desulfatans]|uniref:Uncharacterized protein n=1 Tax=Pontiella desulfatans TaxID=2750659 RepID=A0A6C2U7L0_PONDE|nr:hypothetical protein [Pontiella desulfatans]VGO15396.1 hypothetical protein PDESU_03979 [Pontiella desulfatans]
MKLKTHAWRRHWPVVGCLLLGGCAKVPVHQQRLAAKPNMTFSDSQVFNYGNSLQSQIEPGSATLGASTSSGCTSCK